VRLEAPLKAPGEKEALMAMDMAIKMPEAPAPGRGRELRELPGAGLARETYATFLLLAVAGFIIAGYVGLALFFVGALR
jgi:hypothetical protein